MKAPEWLRLSFRDGVDEREAVVFDEGEVQCWLAQFDKAQRPCEGRFERFHFVNRQRVEHALFALLPAPALVGSHANVEVAMLAAWDCRNGGIACEAHHRRLDSHLVPLPSEELVVPYSALPEHVLEFASDWGLEDELEARFESPAIEGAVG